MKKLFVLFAFLGFVSFSATAQSCNPAACKKAHKTSSVDATQSNAAAVKLASLDKTIETKTCATSGKVSFTRKNVCATSGKVSYTDVEYCSKSAKFVNVSPSAKASCSKTKASCSAAKGASAKQVSAEAAPKKACCAKGTSKEECAKMKAASAKQVSNTAAPKKACCAGKAKSSCSKKTATDAKVEAKPATATDAKVKLISNKN